MPPSRSRALTCRPDLTTIRRLTPTRRALAAADGRHISHAVASFSVSSPDGAQHRRADWRARPGFTRRYRRSYARMPDIGLPLRGFAGANFSPSGMRHHFFLLSKAYRGGRRPRRQSLATGAMPRKPASPTAHDCRFSAVSFREAARRIVCMGLLLASAISVSEGAASYLITARPAPRFVI